MIPRKHKEYLRSFLRLEGELSKIQSAQMVGKMPDEYYDALHSAMRVVTHNIDAHPLTIWLSENVEVK